MAEYPSKTCGTCPTQAKFDKAQDGTEYLEKNTVPQPNLVHQNKTPLNDQTLGVSKTYAPPDLKESPAEKKKPSCTSDDKQNLQKGNLQQEQCSCQMPTASPELIEPCPESPYSLEKCKGEKKQQKGILKKPPMAAAMAGRMSPGAEAPHAEPSNANRPEEWGAAGPCFLPQPGDDMPNMKPENEMGPIGPWATGRVDWSPIAGLTGTRPVVDKYSIARFSEGEWRRHNKEMVDMATEAQHRANLVDWNGRKCLTQSTADVDKNQADSTKRLIQREHEIRRWKCELEAAIGAVTEEIETLENERRRLKQASAVLMLPESIAGECLERRTGRLDSELVRDEVEVELVKELALTAEIRQTFQKTLSDIEKQMVENKTAKSRLEYDWSDKSYTHEIEAVNVALNNTSTIMLFKSGSTMFPDEQSTPEHWEHFTRETLQEGEATRQRSVALRSTLDAILTNASRDIRSQADRVDAALSQKVACTDQIRMQLENDLKKILQRLADVEDLIRDTRDTVRRMDGPMKKAQTRLDNRLQRPRVENCRDDAHFGLVEEVKTIGENVAALMTTLKQAEASQTNLMQSRSNLEREIMVKRKTLEIDRSRIQLIRSHFPSATALSGH